MTQIRPTLAKKNELYISKHAFYSVYHFALQYPEWKEQYADMIGAASKAIDYSGMPGGTSIGDPTARIAMRSSVLGSNIRLVEHTALTAGKELYEWLMIGVTQEGVTYKYLRSKLKIPCGKNEYYKIRRLFYYLLYQAIEERGLIS